MRIREIRERTVPISRYADLSIPSGGLTTSLVALTTDQVRDGRAVTGYGFASFGRFGQGGLIRERFAPRLLAARPAELLNEAGTNFDPFRAWTIMMAGEKAGGHGERCVAVGALDMAVWDLAAKLAGEPLHRFIAAKIGARPEDAPRVRVYASGGYIYPGDDLARLAEEERRNLDAGYRLLKIKIGSAPFATDRTRIEAVLKLLPAGARLAVDAMNAYVPADALAVAEALAPLGLLWLEDICDPHDFDTQAEAVRRHGGPIAVGEPLFSLAEAKLLDRYGGLRRERDILLFDPAHCYGLTHYLEIVAALEATGWPRRAFWPHGGHLFSLHVAAALRLGGSEMNPNSFKPFGGLQDGAVLVDGMATPPDAPGIGFERKAELLTLIRDCFAG
jgi:L-alanine-DL-glutamate epimerase-like enolase superfamily enzyme